MKRRYREFAFVLLLMILLGGCLVSEPTTITPTATDAPGTLLTITPKKDATVIPSDTRPNILLILTDDLDAELGTIQYMPSLQELLVKQGLTMEDYYISTSFCCPSRATYLRGQYTHNHGVLNNTAPQGGFSKFYSLQNESSTLATWLQSAGYETVLLGKYLNGYPLAEDRNYVPVGWTEWYSPAKGRPYASFTYTLNENGRQVDYQEQGQGESLYLTDVLGRKAVDFINRSAQTPSPFFIYLSTFAPHEPARPATRHALLFPDLTAPHSLSFNETDVLDKPLRVQSEPPLSEEAVLYIDQLYRQRVRSMQAVDEMIVNLVSALKETGQLENTYIIFTSDNGFHLGQHRLRQGKGTFYEEDIRVPFIIRGPGIQTDTNLSGYLTGNIDVAPTVAELAGVIPPEFVDGRSMADLFGGNRPPVEDWRSAYLLELYGQDNESEDTSTSSPDITRNLGLRTKDYLYTEYSDGFVELYDMNNDPYQLENIASNADPALLHKLSAWLNQLKECSGSQCRTDEMDIWK